MVRGLDDVKVMLNDDHGVAGVHEFLQYFDKLFHVVGVQTGGRFIQDVHRPAGPAAGKLGRQLDPLRFAAGKGSGGLPDLDVPQPHVVQGLQLAPDLG